MSAIPPTTAITRDADFENKHPTSCSKPDQSIPRVDIQGPLRVISQNSKNGTSDLIGRVQHLKNQGKYEEAANVAKQALQPETIPTSQRLELVRLLIQVEQEQTQKKMDATVRS